MSQLTLRETMWLRDGAEYQYGRGEPIRYEVIGLPPGESATIARFQELSGFTWKLMTMKHGVSSGWIGEYLSPVEALAVVTHMQQADDLSESVLSDWEKRIRAGQPSSTQGIKYLVDKACEYRAAKYVADQHRLSNAMTEADAVREAKTREVFARECYGFRVRPKS